MRQDENAKESAPSPRKVRRTVSAEKYIAWGATVSAIGLGLSLTDVRDFGGTIALVGLATCLLGLHRFGRSGIEPLLSKGE